MLSALMLASLLQDLGSSRARPNTAILSSQERPHPCGLWGLDWTAADDRCPVGDPRAGARRDEGVAKGVEKSKSRRVKE